MKLQIALVAGLLLFSSMALAQQTDTKPDQDAKAAQSDNPKANSADNKPGQDTKDTKPDKSKSHTKQDSKPDDTDPSDTTRHDLILDLQDDAGKVPVLGDLPLIGNMFRFADGDAKDQTFTFWSGVGGKEMDQRVSLDANDMPVKQALKMLFDQVKQPFEAENDIPDDAKITLKLNNVRFGTALDALTESAGIGWQRQYTVKDKKANLIYKVGKKLKTSGHMYSWPFGANPMITVPNAKVYQHLFDGNGKTLVNPDVSVNPRINIPNAGNSLALENTLNGIYNLTTREDRHTFTCPYCGEQVTIIGKREAPKCEKCGRTFQNDWKFCPFDGTKRPASPDTWQFCPHCGKRVSP